MEKFKGDKTAAANYLGISRTGAAEKSMPNVSANAYRHTESRPSS
ncbi:helix-turn-helix domain-containing protein [Escherichia coli]